MKMSLVAASAVALLVPLAGGAPAATSNGTMSDTLYSAEALDQWESAQVVDGSDNVHTPTLISTQRGRSVVVYRVGRAVWTSSRPAGADMPWSQPQQLLGVPKASSVGPVATGSDGGATFFLRGDFGGWAYTHMDAAGDFGAVRTFPYQDQFPPSGEGLLAALERPNSALVVAGMTFRQVKAAVKPPNAPWMLSPGLSVGDKTVLRGLWNDGDGRVHVLVTPSAADSSSVRGLYEVVLHQQDGVLSWGQPRQLRTGVVGALRLGEEISVLSTADGAITVLWRESDGAGPLVQLMRHRTATGNWTPVRRMQAPALPSLVGSLDDSGATRLSYITGGEYGSAWQLVTRKLSPAGTLRAPTPVGEPIESNKDPNVDGVSTPAGATLLRWRSNGDAGLEQHFFRCLSGAGCTGVGTMVEPGFAEMAVTPAAAAVIAGINAVQGCPASTLCSRRLPPP